jgi:hypothetical protein
LREILLIQKPQALTASIALFKTIFFTHVSAHLENENGLLYRRIKVNKYKKVLQGIKPLVTHYQHNDELLKCRRGSGLDSSLQILIS